MATRLSALHLSVHTQAPRDGTCKSSFITGIPKGGVTVGCRSDDPPLQKRHSRLLRRSCASIGFLFLVRLSIAGVWILAQIDLMAEMNGFIAKRCLRLMRVIRLVRVF